MELLWDMLIGLLTGIVSGVISGILVTKYYRKKDIKKEKTRYFLTEKKSLEEYLRSFGKDERK